MLYILLLLAAACIATVHLCRQHFNRRVPPFRLDSMQQNGLQVRRYPKQAVAEVRVSGTPSMALKSGSQLLSKYFRDEHIARFALPLLAEKVDAADSIWCHPPTHSSTLSLSRAWATRRGRARARVFVCARKAIRNNTET